MTLTIDLNDIDDRLEAEDRFEDTPYDVTDVTDDGVNVVYDGERLDEPFVLYFDVEHMPMLVHTPATIVGPTDDGVAVVKTESTDYPEYWFTQGNTPVQSRQLCRILDDEYGTDEWVSWRDIEDMLVDEFIEAYLDVEAIQRDLKWLAFAPFADVDVTDGRVSRVRLTDDWMDYTSLGEVIDA